MDRNEAEYKVSRLIIRVGSKRTVTYLYIHCRRTYFETIYFNNQSLPWTNENTQILGTFNHRRLNN
jgi:hypothetical protein